MLRRLTHIALLLTLAVVPGRALVSVRPDPALIALMGDTYAEELVQEGIYTGNVDALVKHYPKAILAATGLYYAKSLERKAMQDVRDWQDENYYYRAIYNLVGRRIIPMTWLVAGECIKDPSTALYWAPTLIRTCADVQALCKEFETVCTNGKLSFAGLPFLDIAERFKETLDIVKVVGDKIAHGDWKAFVTNMFHDIEGGFTKEALDADGDNLTQAAVDLAISGVKDGMKSLLKGSSFTKGIGGKVNELRSLITGSAFDSIFMQGGQAAMGLITKDLKPSDLLTSAGYNLVGYVSNYLDNITEGYYTQTWYIYNADTEAKTVWQYTPSPLSTAEAKNGGNGEWYVSTGSRPSNFEAAAKATTQEYIRRRYGKTPETMFSNDANSLYSVFYDLHEQRVNETFAGGFTRTHYCGAYSVRIQKKGRAAHAYEEVLDTQKEDPESFKMRIYAKCDEMNRHATEPKADDYGTRYAVGHGEPREYNIASATTAAGASEAKIYAECTDLTDIESNVLSYKCKECGKRLDDRVKNCAYPHTAPGAINDPSVTESFDDLLAEDRRDLAAANASIDELNAVQRKLLGDMAGADSLTLVRLRSEYESNKTRLTALEEERRAKTALLDAHLDSLAVQQQDFAEPSDLERIPETLRNMSKNYGIVWDEGTGVWTQGDNDYTYHIKGRPATGIGEVTYTAKCTMASGAKYFLGIRIHRARIKIDYRAQHIANARNLVEVVDLSGISDAQAKADKVNERVNALRDKFPECSLDPEMRDTTEVKDSTENVIHLLWPSQRLEVARNIHSRLLTIYSDLVIMHRWMHYKRSVIDWLLDLAPAVDIDMGRRYTVARQCQHRWLTMGGSRRYAGSDYIDERRDKGRDSVPPPPTQSVPAKRRSLLRRLQDIHL